MDLFFLSDDSLLLFDKQAFWIESHSNREKVLDAPISRIKKCLSYSRLATRLLRLEPRCTEQLSNHQFVVCYGNQVWLLDILEKSISVLWKSRDGFSTPLNLSSDGQCVYWGDYGNNVNHKSVNIYRLNTNLRIEKVYSFPEGAIRHIHNVIWDKERQRFYVLTGDLEEASGIYIADKGWKSVTPVVIGKQQYRAVVAFPCQDGLIYATDSVSEKNNIYILHNGDVRPLASFPGSCIYGLETKDYYVFSSTIEPPEGRGFFNLFTYKLGKGIKDRYAHLITVRKCDLRVEEIHKAKKDIWPMKLFQYGTFMFPKGQNESNDLFFFVVACIGDGKNQRIHLD